MEIYSLYGGENQKPDIFFCEKFRDFVSVIKKPDIYFFGENQRFLLALKKNGHLFLWTFIFSDEVAQELVYFCEIIVSFFMVVSCRWRKERP